MTFAVYSNPPQSKKAKVPKAKVKNDSEENEENDHEETDSKKPIVKKAKYYGGLNISYDDELCEDNV